MEDSQQSLTTHLAIKMNSSGEELGFTLLLEMISISDMLLIGAEDEEEIPDKRFFYWKNKFTANAVILVEVWFCNRFHNLWNLIVWNMLHVLLSGILYFPDVGFQFEDSLHRSSNATRLLICS
ncbi:hypothetical protein M5689_021239 [Euphorbia peplus]|nr:hypothetical protein M5689_021239 [Euphorbia peplus]